MNQAGDMNSFPLIFFQSHEPSTPSFLEEERKNERIGGGTLPGIRHEEIMRGNSLSRPLLLFSCPLRRLITSPSSSSSSFPPLRRRFKIPKMDPAKSSHFRTISSQSRTKVDKFQQVFNSHSTDGGWQKCWKEGLTPWDLGQPTPILLHLHKAGALPKGRALVPGCGSGYDVVAIADHERHVVGIDISETAIEKALELSSSSNGEYFEFLKADFFAWCPTELFDFIFDYTFFCALEPSMRSSWAVKMRDLLKPDGELMTLMFPVSDHKGGPPYKVSVADYEEVLRPVGFEAISIEENELAVAPRKGAETLARWKRSFCQSSL